MTVETPINTARRVEFPGINPVAFEHPVDRTALQALRKTPGLDLLLEKLASLSFERQVRLMFTSSSLRLSPRQCPALYELFRDACRTLDMKEPDLYLTQNPFPNAFAIGFDHHTVVITSGLVELLTDDEVRCVMGHELGHIKSGHMLYRTMAIFLGLLGRVAARNLPFVDLLTRALLYALYDWTRKSELTADRAGLLVAQDPDVCVRVDMKLAGGSGRVTAMLNEDEFIKQADDYDDMGDNLLDALYQFDMTAWQTHPFPALRAREIRRWSETEEYRRILRGEYPRMNDADLDRRCKRCMALVENPMFRFCPECGETL
jgi:Zn-dependent protease with chaperone function